MTPQQELFAVLDREEFVSIEMIVRALNISRRVLLRSWNSEGVPYIREGRKVRLHRDIVKARYYHLAKLTASADVRLEPLTATKPFKL